MSKFEKFRKEGQNGGGDVAEENLVFLFFKNTNCSESNKFSQKNWSKSDKTDQLLAVGKQLMFARFSGKFLESMFVKFYRITFEFFPPTFQMFSKLEISLPPKGLIYFYSRIYLINFLTSTICVPNPFAEFFFFFNKWVIKKVQILNLRTSLSFNSLKNYCSLLRHPTSLLLFGTDFSFL